MNSPGRWVPTKNSSSKLTFTIRTKLEKIMFFRLGLMKRLKKEIFSLILRNVKVSKKRGIQNYVKLSKQTAFMLRFDS